MTTSSTLTSFQARSAALRMALSIINEFFTVLSFVMLNEMKHLALDIDLNYNIQS